MLEFLLLPQNFPFSVALAVMLGIAVMEGVGTLFGAGLSSLLDSLIPDFDVDVDLDLDADADQAGAMGHGFFTGVLGWLQVGRVPVLVLLVIFLTGFGLIGLAVQGFVHGLLGLALPSVVAAVPAFLGAMPVVRVAGGLVARLVPKEETAAVSRESFVGRVATIVLGTAATGAPAQARLRDTHGRTHYVMVEPDMDGETFSAGESVLLVRSAGPRFRVIAPPSDTLLANEDE